MSAVKPYCPYCPADKEHPEGIHMEYRWETPLYQTVCNFWWQCPICGSRSPVVIPDPNPAGDVYVKSYLAAMRRSLPMQKPLTLDEVKELRREPVFLVSLGEDFDDSWQLCLGSDKRRIHLLMFYVQLYFSHYGKTWIAFRRPPTEEEREAMIQMV